VLYRHQRNRATTGNQTICYVIAYDIPSDKRRTKIHKILLGHGKWTQYSLFECFLTRKELLLLQTKLARHLLADQDSVRFYPLCANCVARVETVGGPPPEEDQVYIL
jgi:CRISPR-associated protein Cas2